MKPEPSRILRGDIVGPRSWTLCLDTEDRFRKAMRGRVSIPVLQVLWMSQLGLGQALQMVLTVGLYIVMKSPQRGNSLRGRGAAQRRRKFITRLHGHVALSLA